MIHMDKYASNLDFPEKDYITTKKHFTAQNSNLFQVLT